MKQELQSAIINLKATQEALDKVCNNSKYYNTELGYLLEQMSYEMLKSTNELEEIRYMYG